MVNLTKNLRKYKAILKDGTELHITQEQYATIILAKQDMKSNDFITIKCPDTGKIEYCGELGQIKQLIEKEDNTSNYYVICDYGNKHELINGNFNCDCYNKYGFKSSDLKEFVKEKYGIIYSKNITEEMRRECWLKLKKEGKI